MPLTVPRIGFTINATHSNSLDLASTALAPLTKEWVTTFANGTGLNQADLIAWDTRTLGAANEDLDLSPATLTNPFGAAVTFARIKGLLVYAYTTNTPNVVVGAAAGAPWNTFLNSAGTATLHPGALLAAFNPTAAAWAVTATTADLLRIANSSGGSPSVQYDIVLLGASA